MSHKLTPTAPYEWVRVVRRVRLGSTSTKLVALLLADYASPDGGDVRPGIVRLAAVAEMSERSVMRALLKLRDLGLIERVFEGASAGRKGMADEYRLTIPDGLLESIPMLDPGEMVNGRGAPKAPSDPVDNPDLLASNQVTSEPEQVTSETGTGDTGVTPPIQAPTSTTPTKIDGWSGHRAEVEDPPVIIADIEKRQLESDDPEKRYATASRILGRHADLGAQFMTAAQTEIPDATLREIVIRAAQLAAKGIPA